MGTTGLSPNIVSNALGSEKDMTPEQIVEHDSWSEAYRLRRLEKMKIDAVALQRAAGEGMAGGENADLQAIEQAIDAVKANQSEDTLDGTVKPVE